MPTFLHFRKHKLIHEKEARDEAAQQSLEKFEPSTNLGTAPTDLYLEPHLPLSTAPELVSPMELPPPTTAPTSSAVDNGGEVILQQTADGELNHLIEDSGLGTLGIVSTSQNLSDAVVGSSSTSNICHECGESFGDLGLLEDHVKVVHQGGVKEGNRLQQIHQCLLCPVADQEMMSFATKKELRSHEREFHQDILDSKARLT